MFTMEHAWPFANTSMELYKGYLGEKDNMAMAWAEGANATSDDEDDEEEQDLPAEPQDPAPVEPGAQNPEEEVEP